MSQTTTSTPNETVPVSRATLNEMRDLLIDLYEHIPADSYALLLRAVRFCNRNNALLQYHLDQRPPAGAQADAVAIPSAAAQPPPPEVKP